MKAEDFQFGDIIATRSNSFLSRGIRTMMHLYKDYADGYSHIAVVIDIWGEKWVCEALGWGVRLQPLETSGYIDNDNILILRHKRGFTMIQIKNISWKMASLAGVRYQYENLPMWIAKILFHLNLFKAENEKSIYCSELGSIAINTAYPGSFPRPNETSPADHVASKIYEQIKP